MLRRGHSANIAFVNYLCNVVIIIILSGWWKEQKQNTNERIIYRRDILLGGRYPYRNNKYLYRRYRSGPKN